MPGPYVEALIERKHALTEQLRQIDEAEATADGGRDAQPGDLPYRHLTSGRVEVRIGELWFVVDTAVELTRAALHECDQGLEDVGLLPKADA